MQYFPKKIKTLSILIAIAVYFSITTAPIAHAASCAGGIAAALGASTVGSVISTAVGGLVGVSGSIMSSVPGVSVLTGALGGGVAVPVSESVVRSNTTGILGSTVTNTTFNTVQKPTLDTLSYSVAQCALQMLTDSTVNWIKGGFNGSPMFAVDPAKLFSDLANEVSGGLANQILGIPTCEFTMNFNGLLSNMVSNSSWSTSRFNGQIRCPFPQNINPMDFYNDFNKGGWKGFERSLSDSGNPYGTTIITADELMRRQAEAQHLQEKELDRNLGFLSVKECANTDPNTGLQTDCKVTTPGSTISNMLSKSLETDMDKLGFADNMNKIISALIGQLTNSMSSGVFKI